MFTPLDAPLSGALTADVRPEVALLPALTETIRDSNLSKGAVDKSLTARLSRQLRLISAFNFTQDFIMAHTIEASATVAIAASADLFTLYQPGDDVYFASAKHQLLAKPPFAALLGSQLSLSERVDESLRFASDLGFNNAAVVGAIPFDSRGEAFLRLSTQVLKRDLQMRPQRDALPTDLGDYTVANVPAEEAFLTAVRTAVDMMRKGQLDKVVLSRAVDVDCEHQADVKTLVHNLDAKNKAGFTFAVPLKKGPLQGRAPARTLIGASPELLISKRGTRVVANPLAGSEPRSADADIDQQRAQRLFNSQKDRYEHDLVIKAIDKALRPFCRWLHVPKQPSLVSTDTMWHLGTRIEGELFHPGVSSLRLAQALHPTPAVGGHPQKQAQALIHELEGYERNLFAGMVGWCDQTGDGEWVVTIRCAEVAGANVRLYAGAGIVAESIPEKELAETDAKLNTMLNAIGAHNREASNWHAEHEGSNP